jgi:heat shock protein HslJ
MRLAFASAVLVALFASTLAGTRSSLTANPWLLTSLGGKKPLVGTHVTATFSSDGKLSGSSGCNHYSGTYTTRLRRMTIGSQLASTQMACPGPVMAQETAYLKALASVSRYDVSGSKLTLRSGAGRPVLVFAVESQGLAGTSWTVTSYNNGKQAVVSVMAGTTIDASFGKSSVSGSAGCNDYNATYQSGTGTISFGPIGATRKECPSPAGLMTQEQAYLAALSSAATYTIDGATLELRTKGGEIAIDARRR